MIVESYEDVIHISGSLTQNHWETIQTAISMTMRKFHNGVIIDCSQITECTQLGADTFRSAMEYIQGHRSRVIVTAVPANVMDVLKTVPDVKSQLPIATTIEEARQSLNRLHHDDEEEYGKKKKKKAEIEGGKSFVVCLSGTTSDDYLLRVAMRYAKATDSGAFLIFPIVVPRDLPMMAPLPEAESQAEKSLESAASRLETSDIPVRMKIERGREFGQCIEDAANDHPGEPVFVCLPTDESNLDLALKMTKSVLSRVKNPVQIVRGPASGG